MECRWTAQDGKWPPAPCHVPHSPGACKDAGCAGRPRHRRLFQRFAYSCTFLCTLLSQLHQHLWQTLVTFSPSGLGKQRHLFISRISRSRRRCRNGVGPTSHVKWSLSGIGWCPTLAQSEAGKGGPSGRGGSSLPEEALFAADDGVFSWSRCQLSRGLRGGQGDCPLEARSPKRLLSDGFGPGSILASFKRCTCLLERQS